MSLEPGRQIDVSIHEPFLRELPEGWLQMVVDHALRVALPPGEPCQVSLLVTDDATVRQLNREYRGLDEATDVLSFSSFHPGHWEGEAEAPEGRYLKAGDSGTEEFPLPPDELPPLGEVVISYPQAGRQAQERNEPVEKELALLIVHGVLHLIGHDHVEPEETAEMQAREQTALAAVFPPGAEHPASTPGSGEAQKRMYSK